MQQPPFTSIRAVNSLGAQGALNLQRCRRSQSNPAVRASCRPASAASTRQVGKMQQEAAKSAKRGREQQSVTVAKQLQDIEVRQAGLARGAVARHFSLRVQEASDAKLAQLIADEDVISSTISPEADQNFAQALAEEQKQLGDERLEIEQMDKALVLSLLAEDRDHLNSLSADHSLAITLQAEHGRAGKLLSRAEQLQDFLDAPLGTRPMPKHGDVMPETLRRIVEMSAAHSAKSHCGKLSPASPFRTAGTNITTSPHGSYMW